MNAIEQGSRFVVRLCSCIGSGDNAKVASKLTSLLKELRSSSGGSALQTQSPALYERILMLVQSLHKAVELAETAGGVAAMQAAMSACSKLLDTVASADSGDFFVQSLLRDCAELKAGVQVLGLRCLQASLDATLAAALLDGSNITAAMQAWNDGARSASQPPHALPPPNDRLMRVATAYLAKHNSAKEAAARLSDLKGEQDRLASERNAANARSQAAELALGETLAKMHSQSVQLAAAESECAAAKRAAAEATARADHATEKAHKAQLEVLPLQQRVALLEGQVTSLTAQLHDEQDSARRAAVRADDCFRDKELALHELHISNTTCASVTAERDRLRDRIVEMELEVADAFSQRHVAKAESAKVGAQLAAAEGWRQEWLQVHHALRTVVRKIEGDYGNEDNLNTRATAIMSNLQERALAEANAKAEVRRMQERLTLCEVERNVLEKRLLEFDAQFVQMRARAAAAENAVAFQLQPSPRHQVLMSNAADIVRGSGGRFGAPNERGGLLALPMSAAQRKPSYALFAAGCC